MSSSSSSMTFSSQSSSRQQSRQLRTSSSMYALSLSPPLDTKGHKHYRQNTNVAAPNPRVKHAATWSGTADRSASPDSFLEVRKHEHYNLLPKYIPSLPNPVHSVEDHIAAFRFRHAARAAKRDARRLSEHRAKERTGSSAVEHQQQSRVETMPDCEEVAEDWTERDAQAWADELKKREAAKRMCVTYAGCGCGSGRVHNDE